ncbi:tetratricopeptide repeat protein [bacterium]|nr:tetratricopeptide repeat protein [bacterium]RQV97920.1 MAG: tetratricopeptide repeat protein [bacterium]
MSGQWLFHRSFTVLSLVFIILRPSVLSAADLQEVYVLSESAVALVQRRHIQEAVMAAEHAYAICKAELSPEHPWRITCLQMLAELYRYDERYDKAEEFYKQFIQFQNSDLPSGLLDKALALNNLATIYHEQQQFDKAQFYYNQAFCIYQEMLGSSHQYTKNCLENINMLNIAMGSETIDADEIERRIIITGRNQ